VSARKPDPIIAAWIRLQAAEKADSASYNELDKAEVVAKADSGFNALQPRVRIAANDCITMADARRSAKGLPAAKTKEAIEAMRAALADWKRDRRKAGLAPYDAAANRARREWRAAMQAMADTRATTTSSCGTAKPTTARVSSPAPLPTCSGSRAEGNKPGAAVLPW
jgi:hypothetical protein